jgi:hypothetical protein
MSFLPSLSPNFESSCALVPINIRTAKNIFGSIDGFGIVICDARDVSLTDIREDLLKFKFHIFGHKVDVLPDMAIDLIQKYEKIDYFYCFDDFETFSMLLLMMKIDRYVNV